MRRKEIELNTRQPAVVRLANTSVAFTGTFANPEYGPVKESLLATLATELLSNEKTLLVKEKPSEADWVVRLNVTGYSAPHSQQRTQSSSGTTVNYVRWVGSLNTAYQVLDHDGHVHDAGNIEDNYDKEFSSAGSFGHLPFGLGQNVISKHTLTNPFAKQPTVPTTADEVKQILVKDVVSQVASKLGNTGQRIEVKVAGGEGHLDRAVEFMAQNLWARASDQLEGTPTFARPEDESYRQYDLGLVYEAIAYDSKAPSEQRANIFKAAEYYDKALELNPKQKYFVETVARSKDAIARFKALDSMQLADRKAAQKLEPAKPQETRSSAKPTTVSDVIEMYKAGVPEEELKDFIQNATLQFNPHDKDTIMAITKANLPRSVQNEMRKKVGVPPLPSAPQTPSHRTPAKTL